MATVPRFFVEPPLRPGDVVLPSHVARQVTTVLRLRAGDRLVLFDGSGGEWQAELRSAGQGLPRGRRGAAPLVGACARLLQYRAESLEAPVRFTLCQALLKADKFAWVLQKGTELGVAAFVPLITRRVVAAAGPDALASRGPATKPDRWRRIVIEAAEQSGRCVVPTIHPPLRLEAVLRRAAPKVLCWEGEREQPFQDALHRALTRGGTSVDVLIGPEGGFAAEEVQAAIDAGAVVASLGPRTLRSETAALAAAALALLADGACRRLEQADGSPSAGGRTTPEQGRSTPRLSATGHTAGPVQRAGGERAVVPSTVEEPASPAAGGTGVRPGPAARWGRPGQGGEGTSGA